MWKFLVWKLFCSKARADSMAIVRMKMSLTLYRRVGLFRNMTDSKFFSPLQMLETVHTNAVMHQACASQPDSNSGFIVKEHHAAPLNRNAAKCILLFGPFVLMQCLSLPLTGNRMMQYLSAIGNYTARSPSQEAYTCPQRL
jgi:hypothetical protein